MAKYKLPSANGGDNKVACVTYKFQIDVPIPSYSLGLAVGEFEIIPGVEMPDRVTTFAPKTSIGSSMEELNDATECLSAAINFFEDTFGCKLPMQSHNLVFVKDPPSLNCLAGSPYASVTFVSTDHLTPKSMHVPNNEDDRHIEAGNNHANENDDGNINGFMKRSWTKRRDKRQKRGKKLPQDSFNYRETTAMSDNGNAENTSSCKRESGITNIELAGEIANGVAWNVFGTLIKVGRWQDSWLPLGMSLFVSDLFIRHIFGEKEYQLRLRKRK